LACTVAIVDSINAGTSSPYAQRTQGVHGGGRRFERGHHLGDFSWPAAWQNQQDRFVGRGAYRFAQGRRISLGEVACQDRIANEGGG
jgi:hypothetical protein